MELEYGIIAPDYILVDDFRLRRALLPILRQSQGIEEIECLKRRSEIDELVIKAKNGLRIRAGEVAGHNWRLIMSESATAWLSFLEFFFEDRLPKNKNIQIFDLSSYGGSEVGGILAWCSSHDLGGKIDVYDLMTFDQGENYSESCSETGMEVSFVQNQVGELANLPSFLISKKYDLVILRDPGPVRGEENRELWQSVFAAVVASRPQDILVASDNCVIGDIGMGLREVTLFINWLSERGYFLQKSLTSYALQYPTYIYGIQDAGWYLRVVDRVKVFLRK